MSGKVIALQRVSRGSLLRETLTKALELTDAELEGGILILPMQSMCFYDHENEDSAIATLERAKMSIVLGEDEE